MPIVESARVAGVSRSHGWVIRDKALGMPPRVVDPTSAGRGWFLSPDDREEIAGHLAAGLGIREIARLMNRNASTISRESRREAPFLVTGLEQQPNSEGPDG